jgi:hypothetical protein
VDVVVGHHGRHGDAVPPADRLEDPDDARVDAARTQVGDAVRIEPDVGVVQQVVDQRRRLGHRGFRGGGAEPAVVEQLVEPHAFGGGCHQRAGEARLGLAELQRLERRLRGRRLTGIEARLAGRRRRIAAVARPEVRVREDPLDQARGPGIGAGRRLAHT